jgi:eukaryotic-like serine/threonine-protein kinase
MSTDRWRQVEELYHEALRWDASRRATLLRDACAGDEALRRDVESLLAHEGSAAGFLAAPALEVAARAMAEESAAFVTGQRFGSYTIQSPLGAGGMGEVYRARDSRLGRDVAIKVLPAVFTGDPDRLARFEREARILAALSHPHIGAIYGLEDAGGVLGLVLELVEGPTLADRLVARPLAIEKALTIARQIAEALEAAHGRGIIHRDLKPANVKLGHDDKVKVLDFGLAKASSGDDAGTGQSRLPTITATDLHSGAIAGTPAYMSPEQARGEAVDKRTDIWAFGCVLYEMLTGRAVFPGATISDTIAAILQREPEWGALPSQTPAGIRQLLRRCLDKDPNHRLHDIADARIEIGDALSGRQQDGGVVQAPAGSRSRLARASAVALLTLMAAAIIVWAFRPVPTAPEARFEINTRPTTSSSLAIAPDGLKTVFVVRSAGESQLWLRPLDSSSARPLAGTERASSPFWSPDSRFIGFVAGTRLKRVGIDGGSEQTLALNVPTPLGGTWNREGTILFGQSPAGPIFRISAAGGEPAAATRIEAPQQRGHAFPEFLPDGRHFLFFVTGTPEARGVYVSQLDRFETKRLFDADSAAVYAATGHLVFIRERKLLAQAFDPDRLELSGDPLPIAELTTGGTSVSASAAGPIAYRTSAADSGQRQLVWVDRSGRETGKVVYPDTANVGPSLSHDGRRVAVYRLTNGNMDIWSYDTRSHAWDRITQHPGDDIFPLWSRDGTSIVFGSVRKTNVVDLYRTFVNGPAEREELLLSTSHDKFSIDWSPDGRFLLYDDLDPKRGFDIWALPLEGDRKEPFPVVQTEFDEGLAQFSPDGTWIAYQSDRTGRLEIYVRPFRGPGGDDVRISIDGGSQVRWNPNGRELFYLAPDDRLMAVPIRFASNGKAVEPGTPVGLFAARVGGPFGSKYRQQYMVSPDGQSFVLHSVVGETNTSPITVILNWRPKR